MVGCVQRVGIPLSQATARPSSGNLTFSQKCTSRLIFHVEQSYFQELTTEKDAFLTKSLPNQP